LSANLQMARGLEQLAKEQHVTVSELALAWVLRRPELTAAIVGARRPSQINETAGAANKTLSPETLQVIKSLLVERKKALAAHAAEYGT
jgi:aryl-alcohol dehydrogenase-like predicted oxidoreductase